MTSRAKKGHRTTRGRRQGPPDHMKKASTAKKAAAAATSSTAPSPRQQVEQEPRMPTMPASLSAFVQQFLRLLRMPTVPAWLSAFVQGFRPAPVLPPEMPETKKPPRGFQAKMYGFSRKSAAARAWFQKPADRIIPTGPTISQILENDAKVVDPYEQEAFHKKYFTIRSRSESGWDICAVCYFEISEETPRKNLDKHFVTKHFGQARKRCSLCTAMFFNQHLKWHIQYCHPDIAVGI